MASNRARLTADEVVAQVSAPSFEDIGFAKVDHHRAIRKGFPEVVFGMGKTSEQVGRLAEALLERSDRLLVTKTTVEAYRAVCEVAPDAVFDEMSRDDYDRPQGGERADARRCRGKRGNVRLACGSGGGGYR